MRTAATDHTSSSASPHREEAHVVRRVADIVATAIRRFFQPCDYEEFEGRFCATCDFHRVDESCPMEGVPS